MPLTNVQIRPGFNKQVTPTGAEGQWTDGDFVRFRYGLPEKIGGWEQITGNTLIGAVRDQLIWADLDGRRYVALGTNKALIIYFEGAFFDITPLDSAISGATFTTVNTSPTVTVNKTGHGLSAGDLFTFTSVTPPTGAGYVASDFTTNTFEVITVPSLDTFTITMASNAGTSVSTSGAATLNPYVKVGPLNQTSGFGWGTSGWGGSSGVTSFLNGSLNDDTAGTGGSGTSITLTSVVGFPTSGTIKVGTEFISYTGISTNDLTGITRDVSGTRSSHSSGATVEVYLAWGEAFSVAPAGQQLTSTINFPSANAFTDVTVSVTSAGQLSSTFGIFSLKIDQDITVLPAEDQLDFTIGSLGFDADANVTVTSAGSLTGSIGTTVAGLKTPVDVTGTQASFSLGTFTLVQSTTEPVTGIQGTLSLGSHAEIPGQIIGVSGLQSTSSVGSVTVTGLANIDVTGIQMTASVGNTAITSWQEVNLGVNNIWTEVDLAA